MSRVDLDPSLRGEREADAIPLAATGLLGAVVPEGIGLAQGGLSSPPEEELLESGGVAWTEEIGRSMQDPVHTSTGFRNSVKLSWEGSLGAGHNEGPWRPLPRRGPLNGEGQEEGLWCPLPRRGPLNEVGHAEGPCGPLSSQAPKDGAGLDDGTWRHLPGRGQLGGIWAR